jgi:hypothetical protein
MDESKLRPVVDPDFGKRLVSRKPDVLLDEKLFGHQVVWALWGSRKLPFRKGWQDFGMPFRVPHYHEEIQDAWLIVEELRRRRISLSVSSCTDLDPKANNCQELIDLKDEKYQVQRWNDDTQRYDPAVYGRTAQEAICKAAFQILGITE